VAERSIVVHAHAKINLCLEVLGRRPDGLHEVATVLQTVSLADRLRFAASSGITLRCRGMAVTPDNLILQAAHLLRERTGTVQGCLIACHKRIPVAAGLGGGSADAAATLVALNRLWGCGLSAAQLMALAEELGADVPFAVQGGTALATGTGTTLTTLPNAPANWLVLVVLSSPLGDKTREMYGRLRLEDFSDGSSALALATAIEKGRLDYGCVQSAFRRAATERWPEARAAIDVLSSTSPAAVSVAGAGPSVFALYPSRRAALAGLSRVRAAALPAQLHRFVGATSIC